MTEVTYHVKFLAESMDCMNYHTYVFENLEYTNCENHYIMCVRFPNWNQSIFNIGDVGFLNVRFVEAGVDKWFDGTGFNSYRYTNVIFMKFVLEKPMVIQSEVILD
jgi:hypothetical protein